MIANIIHISKKNIPMMRECIPLSAKKQAARITAALRDCFGLLVPFLNA
ncbi:MAG: hypothetical protein KKF57_13750 [Firmicutes bacterium]|nr:hypothetical protein [Bacillota bacterium]